MKDTTTLFLSVIESHKGILYKVANSYCKIEDRDDLIQEIMIQLWKSFGNYNSKYKYSTWVYRIALNVAISFYRKERRRKDFPNVQHRHIIDYTDPDLLMDEEKDVTILQELIFGLKELDKALMLLYLEEKSHNEISEILGITETNVATKIARIKIILKQKYATFKT